MTMEDEIELRIVEYWIDDYPNHLNKVPPELEGKVGEKDRSQLSLRIKKGALDLTDLARYREKNRTADRKKKKGGF